MIQYTSIHNLASVAKSRMFIHRLPVSRSILPAMLLQPPEMTPYYFILRIKCCSFSTTTANWQSLRAVCVFTAFKFILILSRKKRFGIVTKCFLFFTWRFCCCDKWKLFTARVRTVHFTILLGNTAQDLVPGNSGQCDKTSGIEYYTFTVINVWWTNRRFSAAVVFCLTMQRR